jgi:hypothetical protein
LLPSPPRDLESRIRGGDRAFLYRNGQSATVVGIGTLASMDEKWFCWNVTLLRRPKPLSPMSLASDPVLGPLLQGIDRNSDWYSLSALGAARLEILARGAASQPTPHSDEGVGTAAIEGRDAPHRPKAQYRARTRSGIRRVDASLLDKPARSSPARNPKLSARSREREAVQRQFAQMITRIESANTVFEVRPGPEQKPATVRLWLLKAAEVAGREIVVRKSEKGWLVGLATPDRRSRRGRRRVRTT